MIEKTYRTNHHIGCIGGMGTLASQEFIERISICSREYENDIRNKTGVTRYGYGNDNKYSPIILHNASHLPSKNDYLTGVSEKNPTEGLKLIIENLNKSSAEFITIPCNTVHAKKILDDELKTVSSIPFLHLPKVISRCYELGKDNQESALFNKKTIGVLATPATVQEKIYDKAFDGSGAEIIYPDPEHQNKIWQAILLAKEGKGNSEEAKSLITEAFEHLKAKNAEIFITGCTELPLIYKKETFSDIPILNTIKDYARATVSVSKGEETFKGCLVQGTKKIDASDLSFINGTQPSYTSTIFINCQKITASSLNLDYQIEQTFTTIKEICTEDKNIDDIGFTLNTGKNLLPAGITIFFPSAKEQEDFTNLLERHNATKITNLKETNEPTIMSKM